MSPEAVSRLSGGQVAGGSPGTSQDVVVLAVEGRSGEIVVEGVHFEFVVAV